MTDYHAAVVHEDQSVDYCGTVSQDHLDAMRAIAAADPGARAVREHPHQDGALFVLREDGELDWYAPVGAPEPAGPAPEPEPATGPGMDPTRATRGPDYVPGAKRFGDQVIGGLMDHPAHPPRAVWHTTESPPGAGFFASMASFLMRVNAEPQVIYDPLTDRIGQFGPMSKSARALANDGARRTNREGKVCVQVEVLGRAASPWTAGFDPARRKNFRALLSSLRAHGIPDTWPAGKPVPKKTSPMPRTRATWQSRGGHFGHCHVPGNDHWDPGGIDTGVVPGRPG